ncbi:MAG: chorismate synthase, partial [Rikenellaceae bacterium]
DKLEILSGVLGGITTGMPLGFLVRNTNQRSSDYDQLKEIYRPSHADYTWEAKYGVRDHRGGGRSSAREHIARVVAGAIAKQILSAYNISITAFVSQVGDAHTQEAMEALTERMRTEGDSVGGVVSCAIKGVHVGLGEPVFDKFQALLAGAMLSINAAKGFEYGMGFEAATMRGSDHNDTFVGVGVTEKNKAGGILGGVTTGEEIYFRVAFKPASSISKRQTTINKEGKQVEIEIKGRHDPCVAWRAVPVVEAMAAMVTLDLFLLAKTH